MSDPKQWQSETEGVTITQWDGEFVGERRTFSWVSRFHADEQEPCFWITRPGELHASIGQEGQYGRTVPAEFARWLAGEGPPDQRRESAVLAEFAQEVEAQRDLMIAGSNHWRYRVAVQELSARLLSVLRPSEGQKKGTNMGRPRVYSPDRIKAIIRFDPDIHERLVEASAERDLSMNHLTNAAVDDYLDRLIPVDQIMVTRGSDDV